MASLKQTLVGGVIGIVNNVSPLRKLVSKQVINKYAYKTPCRPRAVSMAADYTTWPGLTDKRYTGRHLCRASDADRPAAPPIDEVVRLFERRQFRPATDTNLLFPFFAQWFTDSFLRTKWEAEGNRTFRENESNHEIDLCSIYGVSEAQTTMLREGVGGRLAHQIINGEVWPAPLFAEEGGEFQLAERYRRIAEVDEDHPARAGLYTGPNFRRVTSKWSPDDKRRAFAVGLEHGNSTMANLVMNTLWLREHNRTAAILQTAHPEWDDERLFQTARNVTIVVLLNIVIGDYIVHIAPLDVKLEPVPGMAEEERWYRNNWMAVEFALLYRWHDLIPDSFTLAGQTYPSERMTRAHQLVTEAGLDQVLRDAAGQKAGRIGLGNTAAFLLAKEGANVKRLSLEMGRACGLPSFNAYRRYYGMKPVRSFIDLTGDKDTAGALERLYGHIDRLEWFVGIFAEKYGSANMMGELLTTMVANDAFTQALTNPLLAENVFNEATFGAEGMSIIGSTRTLAEVIVRNTGIRDKGSVRFTV
ncbi:peroxidase family protein [Croceibacterium sp. TMG7-5b_MA50]|uniref:peroxidase family protein n=1 Tax=Croceibacterium sp. TMG7-5b_MA50 TaxID=3121290 RepID=UPI0032221D11